MSFILKSAGIINLCYGINNSNFYSVNTGGALYIVGLLVEQFDKFIKQRIGDI